MVSLNFTFFVLMAMFLGFLWVMHAFVFRPLLALMDRREARIATDKETAIQTGLEAAAVEDTYRARMAAIQSEASLRIVHARRAAQEEHNARVDAFRKEAEHILSEHRATLRTEVREQMERIDPLASELAAAITCSLELE